MTRRDHDKPPTQNPPATDDSEQLERIEALLDSAWDELAQGNLDAAERIGADVDKLEAGTAEVATLRGSVAAARGDVEAAVALYDTAMEIDPDYIDPVLHAAELQLDPIGDFDEAVRLCDLALDIAEEEDEYLDALLLKAEALVQAGDEEEARATLAELPPKLPEPQFNFRAGRSRFDLGDLDHAEKHFRAALDADPELIDALHGLALVYEERDDVKKMVQAYMKVREADLKEPPPPWGVTRERFEQLAEEALAELPERIRTLLANVPILAADYPALELVAEGNDPRMMGFFSGIPYPEQSTAAGTVPHLDCVFLYQRNIERYARTALEVEQEIRTTLLHETGHFFGLNEEELEAMGLG